MGKKNVRTFEMCVYGHLRASAEENGNPRKRIRQVFGKICSLFWFGIGCPKERHTGK